MQLTAEMILTDFGAKLPLDQRRKDALAALARAEHSRTQTRRGAQAWCEERWDLKDYEAKDLLKGNASEAVWERIVKHPNGGWAVVIPIMGAVIGMSLESYIQRQAEEARRERAQWEATEQRLEALSARVAERRRLAREANQSARAARSTNTRVGRTADGTALTASANPPKRGAR